MKIRRKIEIDYGHTLPSYVGFCNQLHGHRGIIVCEFEGIMHKEGSERGMIIDFSVCKRIMMDVIHVKLDHGFAIWNDMSADVVTTETIAISLLQVIQARNSKVLLCDEPPTAEYLASYFFGELHRILSAYCIKNFGNSAEIQLTRIEWWETPNNVAIYTIDDYRKT